KLARSRDILFHAREKRVRPGRDDKVLADWNGLAITGLVHAACVFDRPDWLARAEAACDFIFHQLGTQDGRVSHAWRLGRVTASGLLDDQASMARAALALHEATGNPARLAQAIKLAEAARAHFSDGNGGFFTTADDAADIPLARPRTANDNATPAGNGLLAEVFARLWHLTGEPIWRERTEWLLRAFSGNPDQLAGMSTLLAAADLLEEAATVVVVGDPKAAESLAKAALSSPDPAVVVLRTDSPDGLPPQHPAYGKTAAPSGAAAYICRRQVCGLPVNEPAALAETLTLLWHFA
ncbi:MAG TPA: thioredoxin domain-containing protein, partial [Acetobacteraceae bacterium]|nr:thioredoxin domain-containing protein [Acetobacteraceae bacterium]